MQPNNLDRMIQLAEEFFETKNDPEQLSIDEETIRRLQLLHPCTLTEKTNENGPIVWIIVIPTTHDLMKRFLSTTITEREILDQTPQGVRYDALYLCSALVLPEYQGKGHGKRALCEAISSIQKQHPITDLFCWTWSKAGERLAESVARDFALPLHKRPA